MARYRSARRGWYRIVNVAKFRQPLDETMQSTKAGHALYKSTLELRFMQYADANPLVDWWAVEPFCINYVKPTDNKVHRYFPDFILHQNNKTILVEVKSYDETQPPEAPRKLTARSKAQYYTAVQTWHINQAKWRAAREFCKQRNIHFCILTERDLK